MEYPITSPGLPAPSTAPAPLGEKPAKPPWNPRASGVAALLCGPLAGAIITHINLRRMGEKRKGVLILFLSTVGSTALLLMLFRLTDTGATLLGKSVGYFICPFLFPMLQRKEFEQWKAAHPETAPSGGGGTTGWALVGLLGFLAIVVALVTLPVFSEVHDLEAGVYSETTVVREKEFEILIEIQNKASRPQTLLEIGMGDTLLQGISILDANPPFHKARREPLAGERVYEFSHELPANSKTSVRILAVARTPGEHKGELSVCINSSISCLYYEIALTVTAK